ncbi:MAG TPA: hypothetical protein VF427_06275 [Noviherbaspirillum sp.]
MVSLCLFWPLANVLAAPPPALMLVAGEALLAAATGMQYVIGKAWFWKSSTSAGQTA